MSLRLGLRGRRAVQRVTAASPPQTTRARAFMSAGEGPGEYVGAGEAASSSGPVSVETYKTALGYCEDLVQQYEHNQHLCAKLGPGGGTYAATMALRAFNIETARIMDTTTNPHMGAIRIQWWRDAIESLYRGEQGVDLLSQPVVRVLWVMLRRFHLPKEYFLDCIDAREEDLSSTPPERVDDIVAYAERTQGALLNLALHTIALLDSDFDAAQRAACHVGRFVGLATLIRATPLLAQRSLTYVPQDVIAANGMSTSEFVLALQRGEPTPQAQDVVQALCVRANEELNSARELQSSLNKDTALLFLPAVPADSYLQKLEGFQYNVCQPALINHGESGTGPLQMLLKLRWNSWRGTF